MSKEVLTIDAEKSVFDAARMMKERNISCVIVTVKDEPVGILTERDLVRRVLVERKDVDATTVGSVMSKPLISVEPLVTLEEASDVMKNSNVRTLGVVSGGKLLGIISMRDLVSAEARDIKALSRYADAFFKRRA